MDMEQMGFKLILESDASTDSSINARGFPTIRTSRPPDVPHLPFSSHHCFLVLQLHAAGTEGIGSEPAKQISSREYDFEERHIKRYINKIYG